MMRTAPRTAPTPKTKMSIVTSAILAGGQFIQPDFIPISVFWQVSRLFRTNTGNGLAQLRQISRSMTEEPCVNAQPCEKADYNSESRHPKHQPIVRWPNGRRIERGDESGSDSMRFPRRSDQNR
jgi:hypothetical protein